MEDSKGF